VSHGIDANVDIDSIVPRQVPHRQDLDFFTLRLRG
jgi:hypothetical protein